MESTTGVYRTDESIDPSVAAQAASRRDTARMFRLASARSRSTSPCRSHPAERKVVPDTPLHSPKLSEQWWELTNLIADVDHIVSLFDRSTIRYLKDNIASTGHESLSKYLESLFTEACDIVKSACRDRRYFVQHVILKCLLTLLYLLDATSEELEVTFVLDTYATLARIGAKTMPPSMCR